MPADFRAELWNGFIAPSGTDLDLYVYRNGQLVAFQQVRGEGVDAARLEPLARRHVGEAGDREYARIRPGGPERRGDPSGQRGTHLAAGAEDENVSPQRARERDVLRERLREDSVEVVFGRGAVP